MGLSKKGLCDGTWYVLTQETHSGTKPGPEMVRVYCPAGSDPREIGYVWTHVSVPVGNQVCPSRGVVLCVELFVSYSIQSRGCTGIWWKHMFERSVQSLKEMTDLNDGGVGPRGLGNYHSFVFRRVTSGESEKDPKFRKPQLS